MAPRAFLDRQSMNYYLVYLDEQGKAFATTRKGKVSKRCKELMAEHAHMEHGLWDASEDMGKTMAEVDKNIRAAITKRLHERDEKAEAFLQQLQAQQAERERKEQEALAQRKAVASTKDKMTVKPFDLMQRLDDAEVLLEQMKPGAYYLCINYKKQGFVELKQTARAANHIKVCGIVEREDKPTKAALHRFAVSVRDLYKKNIDIIGRTHAIKSFGQKMTDSIPHLQEQRNAYYATAAPRRYYDRYTLLYLQLEKAEKAEK